MGPAGRDPVLARGDRALAPGAVAIGLLVVPYAVWLLTLPALEAPLHQRAVERGWIDQ